MEQPVASLVSGPMGLDGWGLERTIAGHGGYPPIPLFLFEIEADLLAHGGP